MQATIQIRQYVISAFFGFMLIIAPQKQQYFLRILYG